MNNTSTIHLERVSMHFGGIKAIDDVTFDAEKGKILGIIGPNGAGKTTIFNVISGIYIPTSGEIYSDNLLLNQLPPHKIVGTTVGRTFQNIRLFDDQTVIDNLKIAQYCRIQYSFFDTIFLSSKYREEEKRIQEEAMDALSYLGLSEKANKIAGSLPYGEQRRVEIARALVSKPKAILLDEPAAGMNSSEIDKLNKFILKIRDDFDLSILLVEHQMRLVMNVCDEIIVLNFGKKIASGKPENIRTNDKVLEAYLGKAHKNEKEK